jgi:hypothetical protein
MPRLLRLSPCEPPVANGHTDQGVIASQTSLNIKENCLAIALQMDVKCVDGGAVAF